MLPGCGVGGEGAKQPPYNVVFISIDSLRADHLRSYGYSRTTSPNLDNLAREGTLFENVIAETSWTLPSHVSMLTGLSSYVHRVEQNNVQLDEDVPRLASRLKQEGYRTKGIYSGPFLDPLFGFGVGFDEYEAVGADRITDKGADDRSHRSITSPEITEKAIEFVNRDSNEPFFLFLHYFDVHYGYNPPEELWRKFDPDYQGNLTSEDFMTNTAIHPKMSRRDLEHVIALYDAEILFTDQHIGYLLDALQRNGLAERTLVVVTSDHGDEFFEHGGKGHKNTLFDEQLKVPLLIRMPDRVPAGRRVSSQVSHVDFMPTILDLLGVPLETPVSGTSLVGMLDGSTDQPSKAALSRLIFRKDTWVTVRTNARKYVMKHRKDRRHEVLFDLIADPRELEHTASRYVIFQGGEDRIDFQGGEGLIELDGFMDTLTETRSRETTLRDALGGDTSESVELPDDVVKRLRSLGYIQ